MAECIRQQVMLYLSVSKEAYRCSHKSQRTWEEEDNCFNCADNSGPDQTALQVLCVLQVSETTLLACESVSNKSKLVLREAAHRSALSKLLNSLKDTRTTSYML